MPPSVSTWQLTTNCIRMTIYATQPTCHKQCILHTTSYMLHVMCYMLHAIDHVTHSMLCALWNKLCVLYVTCYTRWQGQRHTPGRGVRLLLSLPRLPPLFLLFCLPLALSLCSLHPISDITLNLKRYILSPPIRESCTPAGRLTHVKKNIFFLCGR